MRTVVGPYNSENRDQFLRFGRFLFVLAFSMNFGQYTDMKLWSDLEEMKEHEEEQRSEGFRPVIRYRTRTKTKLSLSNIRKRRIVLQFFSP